MNGRLVQQTVNDIGKVPVAEGAAAFKMAGNVALVALERAEEGGTEATGPGTLG